MATPVAISVFIALALAAPSNEARRIDLDLKDADIHNVIRLLADVGHVNIVVPDDVSGKVTLKLKNVPWKEALGIVLRSKGLGQESAGNVIQIDTLERITKRNAQKAELRKARDETATLVTVMFPLSYARASELAPLVKTMLTPRGSVQVDTRTNVLIVTDVADNVDRVRSELAL